MANRILVRLLCAATAALALPALAGAQQPPPPQPAPAESGTTTSQTGPLSGYMDFHFNKAEHEDGVLDFHRFVLLFTHSFSAPDPVRRGARARARPRRGPRGGRRTRARAGLPRLPADASFNLRAGMLLVPVGIINERHEPPVFYGVERPFVDTVIVPTHVVRRRAPACTASSGDGLRYRAYVMAPLDAAEFTADEGHPRRPPEGRRGQRPATWPSPDASSTSACPGSRSAPASGSARPASTSPRLDTAGARRRGRRALPARPARAARPVRARDHRRRRALNDALERPTGVDPEHRARAARLLRSKPAYRAVDAGLAARSRRLRPLRELRHAVPHARRLRAAAGVRPRRLGRRRHATTPIPTSP